jgi:CheY-like chemotaxis protein
VQVQGDPLRLVQIVCNLLNNSAKFSSADAAIRVTLELEGDAAELTVADEGIGISAELLPRVFERFVQGEQALQRASGGLGLGLAIAQNLAQLHGGSITARSAGLGQGSAFTVRLPLAAQAQEDERRGDDAVEPARRLRLLLVDDNRDAVDSLAACFEFEGHEVRTAGSAEEAIERLAQAPADGAVFDIGLPGMDGYALARHVRADPRTRMLALIALTGYGRAIDRQHALAAGFDDHFAKPAQPERMLERLQQLLRRDATQPSGA